MSQIAQLGFLTGRLLIEPGLGIRARCVGLVTAHLAAKLSSTSATALIVVLAAKALLPSPSLDQRPIHREVLVRHQPGRLRFHMGEKPLCQVLVQQPITVLAEHGVIPYWVIDLQAHKPAKQQVVVQLLHQQPFAPHRIENLQQQRS